MLLWLVALEVAQMVAEVALEDIEKVKFQEILIQQALLQLQVV
jgi:hypothetical protein